MKACRQGLLFGLMVALMAVVGGCKSSASPQYAQSLGTGESALVKVPAGLWPALPGDMDMTFRQACARSLAWFSKPSSRGHFPVEGVSHEQAQASVFALNQMAADGIGGKELAAQIRRQFNLYMSVGWDGQGTVLFTGYYTPVLHGSRTPSAVYRYPLYRRPSDLVTEAGTGRVFGQRVDEVVTPYPVRRDLEASQMLRGQELVWLADRFDAYLVHIQGSAKLQMADGTTVYVGYAGNNGRAYTSIAKLLVAEGKLDGNRLSLPAVRDYFARHDEELDGYIAQNDRYVFFRECNDSLWPAGSLGFSVQAGRTVATDKSVFPRGGVVLVDTQGPAQAGQGSFRRFMLDQDTGGAIRAAGRADIYMGVGDEAEVMAGRQYAEGRLYYLFLKPDRVAQWRQRMGSTPASALAQ